MDKVKDVSSKIKNGDLNTMEIVFKEYSSKVSGICQRYVKNKDEANDICSSVFVQFFEKTKKGQLDKFADEKIMVVLKVLTLDYLFGTCKKEDLFFSESETTDFNMKLGSVNPNELIKTFDCLEKSERTIFNLHAIDSHSFKEIAEIYESKEDQVEKCYNSAKSKILKQVKEKQSIEQ